jgi:hypothetical protein
MQQYYCRTHLRNSVETWLRFSIPSIATSQSATQQVLKTKLSYQSYQPRGKMLPFETMFMSCQE